MTQMQTRTWTGLFGLDKPEEAPREQGSWTKLFGIMPQNQVPTMPAAPPGVIGPSDPAGVALNQPAAPPPHRGLIPPPQAVQRPPIRVPGSLEASGMPQDIAYTQQGESYNPRTVLPTQVEDRMGRARIDQQVASEFGPIGRFGQATLAATDTAIREAGATWQNLGTQGVLPTLMAGSSGEMPHRAEQYSGIMDEQTRAANENIAAQATGAEHILAGLASMPATFLDPRTIAAMILAKSPAGPANSFINDPRVLGILEQRIGRIGTATVKSMVENANVGGAFGGMDAALRGGNMAEGATMGALTSIPFGISGAVRGVRDSMRGLPERPPAPPEPAAPAPWAKTQYDPEGLGPAPTPWSQTEYTPPPVTRPPAEPAPWSKSQYDPTGVGETPTPWSQTEYAPEGVAPAATPWSQTEYSPVAPNPPESPPATPGEPAPWAKTEYDPSGVDQPTPWSQTEYTPPVRSVANAEATTVKAAKVPRGPEAGEGRAPERADQPGVPRVRQDGAQGGKELLETDFPTWNTLRPGQDVTLYRGEGAGVMGTSQAGGEWWTTDKKLAEKYGAVKSVTVKSDWLGRNAAQGHNGPHEFYVQGGEAKLREAAKTTTAAKTEAPKAEAPKPEPTAVESAEKTWGPLQKQYQQQHGREAKIGYNKDYGYFLETPPGKAPEEGWKRLAVYRDKARFKTPEIEAIENRLTQAEKAATPAKPPTLAEVRRQIKELGAEPIKAPKAKLVEQLEGLKKRAEAPSEKPDAATMFDREHRLSKPIKGKTGSEIIGYRWMSQMEEGMFKDRRVSDWSQAQISEPTGRQIVHLFLVRDQNGVETLMGIGAAKKALGIAEDRLYSIAKREAENQKIVKDQWDRWEAKAQKTAATTIEQANSDYRKANDPNKMMWGTAAQHAAKAEELFNSSALLSKGDRFLRSANPETIDVLRARGWSVAERPTVPHAQTPEVGPALANRDKPRGRGKRPDDAGKSAEEAPRTPPPEAPARRAKQGEFSKSDIDRRLTDWYDRNKGGMFADPDAEHGTLTDSGDRVGKSGQSVTPFRTSFSGKMPTEVREYVRNRPELRRLIKEDVPKGNGDTSFAELQEDWFARLEEAAGSRSSRALEKAEELGDLDPEAGFLAFLRNSMPEKQAERPPWHVVDSPANLPDGTEFSINGNPFKIVHDGNDILIAENVPKNEFSSGFTTYAQAHDSIPIDAGTLRLPKKETRVSKLNADLLGETDRQPITGPQEQMFATGPKTGDWIRKEVETHPARDAVDQEIAKKFDETQTPSMFGDQPPAEPSRSAQVTPPKSVREAGPHRAMGATAAKDPFGGRMSVRDHFSAVRERIGGMVKAAGEAVRAVKDLNSNDTLPKLSRVAPKATEHLVQTVTAHDAYKPIAAHLEERVLGAKYKDEAFSRKVSGVLVEDRLRALKQKFDETADQFVDVEDNIDKIRDFLEDMDPEDPDAIEMKRDLSRLKKIKKMIDDNPDRDFEGEWRAKADAVKSIVGSTHSPFKTEAEFKAAIRDKEVAAALSRWKEQVQTSARKVHEELGGRLDAEGPNTGTFVNLKAITDEALMEHGGVEGSARGRAANARLRKSAHNREATGTAEVYELNLRDLIENTISKNLRRIELKRFYDSLVEEGQAIRAAEGTKFETPDGKPSTVPYIGETALRRIDDTKIDWDERRVESIWVKPEIEREIRNALNVEGRFKDSAIAHTTDWINKTNLKLGVDGVYHLANYLTAMSSTPIGRKWARDMGKKFPGVNIADATAKIVQARARIIADTPEVRAQLAELSKIGALPPPREGAQMMGRLIETLGNASRVAMDDMYTDLVKQGLAKDTVAGRREFVNQLGQYNGRLQHAWVRALKEVGVSPFITAGQNFNKVAIRRIGGLFGMSTGGVAPASAAAAWRLRAGQMASVIIGSFIAPPIINTMTTGSPLGRDGVPIGAIDTGQDANGKPVIVDPLKWTGLRRGLRITGVGKVAEGVRYGRNPLYVAEDAVRDIAHGFVHPFAGPVPDFAMIASTGYDTSGYKVAPAAEPGSSQYITNLITALEHTNPLIGNAVEGGKTGGFTGSVIGGLSAFSGAIGVRTVGGPPNDAARERAQFRDYKMEQRRLQRRGH